MGEAQVVGRERGRAIEREVLVFAWLQRRLSRGVDVQRRSGGQRRLSVVLSSLLRAQQ